MWFFILRASLQTKFCFHQGKAKEKCLLWTKYLVTL
jgi:hypothetical protein